LHGELREKIENLQDIRMVLKEDSIVVDHMLY
jgi:hypothetical protein